MLGKSRILRRSLRGNWESFGRSTRTKILDLAVQERLEYSLIHFVRKTLGFREIGSVRMRGDLISFREPSVTFERRWSLLSRIPGA